MLGPTTLLMEYPLLVSSSQATSLSEGDALDTPPSDDPSTSLSEGDALGSGSVCVCDCGNGRGRVGVGVRTGYCKKRQIGHFRTGPHTVSLTHHFINKLRDNELLEDIILLLVILTSKGLKGHNEKVSW